MLKHTKKAVTLLGKLIHAARSDRSFSQAELAERLGVTRQTVIGIEKGDTQVTIGTVFEAAYILGVPIFSEDDKQLSKWQTTLSGFSGLLPKRSRRKRKKVSDDF